MLLSMLLLMLLHRSPCERQLHTKSAAVSQAVYATSFLVSYGDVRCEMWSTKDSSILLLLPHSPLPPCNNKAHYYTQTRTLSFLPTQNSFKQHKQRSQTSEIHRNLSQSQPEILDLCFLLDKLFVVPTTRDVGGGEEEEPPRNSSKECAKTLSSQTLSNQKILSIFHKLHLTDSRHKLHQNHERQKKTGGKKNKSINKILAQKFLFLSNSHLQGLQDDKSPSKQASKQKQRVQLLFQGRSSQIRHENREDEKEEEEEEEEEMAKMDRKKQSKQPVSL
jgi:hypothetical protein